MADTIKERIIKNRMTALQNIKVANGYANTVKTVERIKQSGQTNKDTPYLELFAGDEESEDAPFPYTQKSLTLYLIMGTRQDESTDPKWADEIVNSLLGDVEKAMAADFTCGALAIDCTEVSNGPMPIEEGMTALETFAEFRITYRHIRTDPTSQ